MAADGGDIRTAILADTWLHYAGEESPDDDARQSRCVYIGCSDCRTYFMGPQKDAVLGVLVMAGVPCEGLFEGNWNRYIVPGGGAILCVNFPDVERDKHRISFLVQYQLHGGETLVITCHRDCGWIKVHGPGMSFAQAVAATVDGAREFQRELAELGKSVRIYVVADRLHSELRLRYKLVAHFEPLPMHTPIG